MFKACLDRTRGYIQYLNRNDAITQGTEGVPLRRVRRTRIARSVPTEARCPWFGHATLRQPGVTKKGDGYEESEAPDGDGGLPPSNASPSEYSVSLKTMLVVSGVVVSGVVVLGLAASLMARTQNMGEMSL